MTQFSSQHTVGDVVVDRPSSSRVFAKFGIDFCCGGKKTIEEACREKRIDPQEVLALLHQSATPDPRSEWAEAPLPALVAHVVDTHHAFTRAELQRLGPMLTKVARVHGERHPFMIEVVAVFEEFAAELDLHMTKEERVLFPSIVSIGRGEAAMNVAMPIRMMNAEHEVAGGQVARMRALTSGFVTPVGGCNTFRAALAGLEELEADLHQHVHLESNILFPRALRLLGCDG